MKTGSRRAVACAVALALVGCYSVQEHRARQFSADYAALSPAVQARVQAARIAIGDSPKAVYFALGTPNYVRPLENGSAEWVYWGLLLEENAATTPPTLHFASRGEIRLPKAGETRTELRLRFSGQELAEWTTGPVVLGASGPHEAMRMGAFPTIP